MYPEPPRAVRVGPPPSDDLRRAPGQGGRVQVGTPHLPSGGLGLLQGGEDMAFKIIFIFEYITPIILQVFLRKRDQTQREKEGLILSARLLESSC